MTVSNNIFIVFLSLSYLSHSTIEYVILIHDVIWSLCGPYDVITSVDGDEDVTWYTENNKPVLHVLLVSFALFFSYLTKSNKITEQFCSG